MKKINTITNIIKWAAFLGKYASAFADIADFAITRLKAVDGIGAAQTQANEGCNNP